FALWERDQIVPERAAEWLEVLSEAPYESIGEWVVGLDVELFALLLRQTSRIYDLSEEEAPDEPHGMFYPTPDNLFVLDVSGFDVEGPDTLESTGETENIPPSARAIIRIIDGLYRADQNLARRLLVGARSELDAELEELAYRWRQGRMADLGFADYYDALEVYRELDPASVRIGEVPPGKGRVRPIVDDRETEGSPSRTPAALVDRMARGGSPFARAAQGIGAEAEIADLHFALVALTNRVLAADRVMPGDDPTVTAALERLVATLDLALDLLARGDAAREIEAVRTIPLVRLFRVGVSLIAKAKRLATTLRRKGPFAATGLDLLEREDAPVLEALSRHRPELSGLLDEPATGVDRPFRTLADLARAAAVVERVAAAQAMLLGLGVTPAVLAPPSALLESAGLDEAAIDAGVLARTALVARLLAPKAGPATPLVALDASDVRDFEALLEGGHGRAARLPEVLKRKAVSVLDAATPDVLAGAGAVVRERWLAALAPLEPVLVKQSAKTMTKAPTNAAPKKPTPKKPTPKKPTPKKPTPKASTSKRPTRTSKKTLKKRPTKPASKAPKKAPKQTKKQTKKTAKGSSKRSSRLG
ncbi:MAG: hypothetical protein JWM82_2562, partial [Myxococcales bacterium]|nr:hypothetical protein [Myxococcales bacterium]